MFWAHHRPCLSLELGSIWFHAQTARPSYFTFTCPDFGRTLTVMSPQCWAYTRALHREKSKSLLYPGPHRCHGYKWHAFITSNQKYLMFHLRWKKDVKVPNTWYEYFRLFQTSDTHSVRHLIIKTLLRFDCHKSRLFKFCYKKGQVHKVEDPSWSQTHVVVSCILSGSAYMKI